MGALRKESLPESASEDEAGGDPAAGALATSSQLEPTAITTRAMTTHRIIRPQIYQGAHLTPAPELKARHTWRWTELARRSTKASASRRNFGGPGWDRTIDQPIMSRPL